MKAEEARQIADKFNQNKQKKELEETLNLIRNKANSGGTKVTVEELSSENIKILESFGYKTFVTPSEHDVVISW